MRICVGPISLSVRVDYSDSLTKNPGIGGSEHYFLVLAERLSRAAGAFVTVLIEGQIPDSENYVNPNLNFELYDRTLSLSEWDVGIFGTGFLTNRGLSQPLPAKVIAVSHHPHDGHLRKLRGASRPFAVVNLGRYQHISNSQKGTLHLRIPSFFVGQLTATTQDLKTTQNLIGHISSLHPSKGFHVIAEQWRRVTRLTPGAKIEVVGGASLYGNAETHPRLPTTQSYGQKLLKILGEDLQGETVHFLGRVSGSTDDIVVRWSAALINPNGVGEADPATLRELIRLGVPVISSRKFGLSEYMDYFPETTVSNARAIPKTLARLLGSPKLMNELRTRSFELAKTLTQRNESIFQAWCELVYLGQEELRNNPRLKIANLQPSPPDKRERVLVGWNDIRARAFRAMEFCFLKLKSLSK